MAHFVESEGNSMKLVSVIIPCYRQARFLGEAIESVLSQTHRNFEIIVVDDGSPDNVFNVTRCYPGVHYIRQENLGQGAARNTGLYKSKGRYLVFLDADDRLLPEALETNLNFLDEQQNCVFVYGCVKLIAANGSPLKIPEQTCIDKDHYLELLRYNYIWTPAVIMFRRDVFESGICYEPSLVPAEDWDLYLRITRSFPIYDHSKVIAEYRLHEKNVTRNPARMLKSCLEVLRSQREYIRGNKHYEEAYKCGIKGIKNYYGNPLVEEIHDHLREFEWKQAIQDFLVILRYYPQGFLKLFTRKAPKRN